ncbi:MAG TPA: polyphosphate kinase 1, partial [Cytophagaceae bacterium]
MTHERFINRDISWLSFNHRVFQEAQDKTVPIIERFKFLGIFSNNRDEFFRVRVGTLRRIEKLGNKVKGLLEEDPTKILREIQRITIQQEENFKAVYENLLLELQEHNIFMINENGLNDEQKVFVKHYFKQNVLRTLVPIMLDTAPVFPELKDSSIYLFIQLVRKQEKKRSKLALIEIPTELFSRFLILPDNDGRKNI